jgi:hypothetical protein
MVLMLVEGNLRAKLSELGVKAHSVLDKAREVTNPRNLAVPALALGTSAAIVLPSLAAADQSVEVTRFRGGLAGVDNFCTPNQRESISVEGPVVSVLRNDQGLYLSHFSFTGRGADTISRVPYTLLEQYNGVTANPDNTSVDVRVKQLLNSNNGQSNFSDDFIRRINLATGQAIDVDFSYTCSPSKY